MKAPGGCSQYYFGKEGIIKTPVIFLSIKNSKEKFYIEALELALQLPNSLKVRSLNLKSSPDHPKGMLLFNRFLEVEIFSSASTRDSFVELFMEIKQFRRRWQDVQRGFLCKD